MPGRSNGGQRAALVVGMNSTEERTGGGQGALQSSLAFHQVVQDHRIYYFGIASEFWRRRAHHYREVPRSLWDDVRARCWLRTNFLCLHIDRFLAELDCDFDVVLLGNSRLGYVAGALRNRARCVVTYHANVEADYIRHKYALPVFSWIDGALFRLRERQCADLTDLSLFLSERDRSRHAELYRAPPSLLCPIGTEARAVRKRPASNLRLAFLGSLSYRPNVRALQYIVSQILPHTPHRLLVAGSSPNHRVRTLVRTHAHRIDFHPDFATLDDVVSERDLFLSPLDSGAGMKVKVAQCVSMGTPILGSAETFVGYELLPHYSYLVCGERDDYLRRIRELAEPSRYTSIAVDLRDAWQKRFSTSAVNSSLVTGLKHHLESFNGSA
jgi:hypothetical protein